MSEEKTELKPGNEIHFRREVEGKTERAKIRMLAQGAAIYLIDSETEDQVFECYCQLDVAMQIMADNGMEEEKRVLTEFPEGWNVKEGE